MDKFTASNGVTIERKGVAALAVERPMTDRLLNINAERVVALREFFRAERDEELGRWRWPENPDYVVYPDDDGDVIVLNEREVISSLVIRRDLPQLNADIDRTKAARAYFEAHPERKPWEDAKPGDVWVFEVDGEESIVANVIIDIRGHRFETVAGKALNVESSVFRGARRIWPEDAS